MSNPNIKKVIAILHDTKDEIGELLKDSPDLKIRADNAFERLANGFAHLSGEKMHFSGDSKKSKASRPELTHIGGSAYTPKKAISVSKAEPSNQEKEEFDGYIEQVYEEFKTNEPKSLLAGANDLVIRAVAKKAGIPVTPTSPKTIDLAFIEKIKAAILKKVELDEEAAKTEGKK